MTKQIDVVVFLACAIKSFFILSLIPSVVDDRHAIDGHVELPFCILVIVN